MNYQETLDYLYTRLPVFTRDGISALKKDLTNTRLLCQALGNPEKQLRTIHVAGTNGKGSTSHALAAILQKAGYRTGLYTSPHLVDFRERIRINGEVIAETRVVDFIQRHRTLIEEVQPSFFELTVVLAFDYFASESVDVAIIETGLGGRLDSTNVILPELSLITNIGKDHADILGDTLEAIASEKAGIIKPGVPVVISEYQDLIAGVYRQRAEKLGAKLVFASKQRTATRIDGDPLGDETGVALEVRHLSDGDTQTYRMDLQGSYQARNLVGILSAVDVLREQGWEIPEQAVRDGLAHIQLLTGLQGRWQTISRRPRVICDTGHNEDGWRVVLDNIARTPYRQLRMVLGVMKDKDLAAMLGLLPQNAVYYFCQVDLPRALPSEMLRASATSLGLKGRAYATVEEALDDARAEAGVDDLIFVGGSTFVVGELLKGIC